MRAIVPPLQAGRIDWVRLIDGAKSFARWRRIEALSIPVFFQGDARGRALHYFASAASRRTLSSRDAAGAGARLNSSSPSSMGP
jgi:hypothetical protein